MNYKEKIAKVNSERVIMLNKAKENISQKNVTLSDNLENTINTLEFDEKNVKKYKSIIKAKEMIASLTEEILNAKSVEDIVKLRSKINYYINKIKKELQKRNVSQTLYDETYNQVKYLRKDIATYIRFLKRESTLEEINNSCSNVDKLSSDEKNKLKKQLRNEHNYNKRYMKKNAINEIVLVNDEQAEEINNEENAQIESCENIIAENSLEESTPSEVEYVQETYYESNVETPSYDETPQETFEEEQTISEDIFAKRAAIPELQRDVLFSAVPQQPQIDLNKYLDFIEEYKKEKKEEQTPQISDSSKNSQVTEAMILSAIAKIEEKSSREIDATTFISEELVDNILDYVDEKKAERLEKEKNHQAEMCFSEQPEDSNECVIDESAFEGSQFIDIERDLANRISYFRKQYKLSPIVSYNGSFIKNITSFLRNIPKYRVNQRIIKVMEKDYNTYYHGQDLCSFLEYSKKRNSIRFALETIFNKSRLTRREIECLTNHDMCLEWITEFYCQQDIECDEELTLYKKRNAS